MRSKTLIKILIVGYGDIGQRVARLWLDKQATVFALARSVPELATLKHIQADLDNPETLHDLPTAAAVVYFFAPPPQLGENDTRMQNFLAAIADDALPQRIVYISTSGVYGDCKGAWVTEQSPTKPVTDRAKRRLAAEQTLQHWANSHQVNTVILRVGGIYGPGRLPLQRLSQGISVLRRDLAPWSNRIHADDLAQVCLAAASAPSEHAIYNVADNQPSTMSDYFIAVAEKAGLPAPKELDWQQAEAELSPAMLSYLHESRRMDNSKMLAELGVELAYPSLDEGLAACIQSK